MISITAQNISAELYAASTVKKLHTGDLIVLLSSEKNKLDVLEKELSKGDKNYQKKILKLKNEIYSSRDTFNLYMIKNFKKNYFFSKIYFLYDEDFSKVKDNNFVGAGFVDSNLHKTISRIDGTRDFFILRSGLSTTQSLDSWIICDQYNNKIADPFPSTYRKNNFKTWKNHLFFSKLALKKDAAYYSIKIQDKLERFYRKNEVLSE